MTDKNKLLDLIHIKIHALRMMDNYNPSKFEQELNKMIAEEYSSSCSECKDKSSSLKNQPIQQKQGFLGGLFK